MGPVVSWQCVRLAFKMYDQTLGEFVLCEFSDRGSS
jgi:hypothetical protein